MAAHLYGGDNTLTKLVDYLHIQTDKTRYTHYLDFWYVSYMCIVILNTYMLTQNLYEPMHEISNNVLSAISKASDQPAHKRSLIRAFASRLSIL